jgi:hypothetical protein
LAEAAWTRLLVGGPFGRSFASRRALNSGACRSNHSKAAEAAALLLQTAPANRDSRNRRTPDELGGKEKMITELRGVRERTLAFLEETHGRDLSRYIWQHPFLGYLNFYEWFRFIAARQKRHANKCGKLRKIYQKV